MDDRTGPASPVESQIAIFLIKLTISIDDTVESQESRNRDSASLRLGVVKIDSRISLFWSTKRVMVHDYATFYKDLTGPPELVKPSHRHQPRLASLAFSLRLDWWEYSEPWTETCFSSRHHRSLGHN